MYSAGCRRYLSNVSGDHREVNQHCDDDEKRQPSREQMRVPAVTENDADRYRYYDEAEPADKTMCNAPTRTCGKRASAMKPARIMTNPTRSQLPRNVRPSRVMPIAR